MRHMQYTNNSRKPTENGTIDDISIREPHFDRMIVILYFVNENWYILVHENNITTFMQGYLK